MYYVSSYHKKGLGYCARIPSTLVLFFTNQATDSNFGLRGRAKSFKN